MRLHTPNTSRRVLVTGATGFIGSALVRSFSPDSGWTVRGAVRQSASNLPTQTDLVAVGELSASTNWRSALRDVNAIVHTAARVHVMAYGNVEPLAEFRRINVNATLNLARQAVESGVQRFVFVSSIKVNGESTPFAKPFTAADAPNPSDAYGISKHEAEVGLRELATETGIGVVIIRPVLVYGPGVRANFLSMMRWLDRGIPLPLAAIHNARSLVALDNLVDLLRTCVRHPAAANQTLLVSDDEDLSTPELLRRLGAAMRRPARLIPVPTVALRHFARIAGKPDVAQRLLDSLQVDIGKTRRLLTWHPPITLDQGLLQTARYFLDKKSAH